MVGWRQSRCRRRCNRERQPSGGGPGARARRSCCKEEPMSRLLITGFEPFGGESVNPSSEAARALTDTGLAGVVTSCLILPVVRFRCIDLAVEAIERQRPDLVVLLGQAGGRAQITPERVAINVDDFRQPDNAGHHPVDEPIVPGGPAAY